uniref:Uncharacterized protein n=1 Tax=Rhizophora mucronata TaxID=61149 RepID=A0A2P2QQ50_RHIMU
MSERQSRLENRTEKNPKQTDKVTNESILMLQHNYLPLNIT